MLLHNMLMIVFLPSLCTMMLNLTAWLVTGNPDAGMLTVILLIITVLSGAGIAINYDIRIQGKG